MKYASVFFSILTISAMFLFVQKQQVHAAACPLPQDTKTNQDLVTGLCYSESDPLFNTGLNTTGGTRTCGPVRCPGIPSAYPVGNTCILQVNGQCFPGQGPSGFNTPGCTASSITPLPRCPNPMTLTIHVADAAGTGINGINFTVTYADAPPSTQPGKNATTISNPVGTAVLNGQLYSGDHFIIVPSSPYYTFNPAQIGSNTIGAMEMNTNFPGNCGTSLENGTSLPPCIFTATRNNVPLPSPYVGMNGQTQYDANLVNETTASTQQTFIVLGALGLIGYAVLEIGGSGGVKQ